jgi:hypothetical protein
MSEHTIMMVMLGWCFLNVSFVGFLVYRVLRRTDHLEGVLAATYFEARRALSQHRP